MALRALRWLRDPIEEVDKLFDAAHKRENVIWKRGQRRLPFNHFNEALNFDFGVYGDEENVQSRVGVAVLKDMTEGR